MINRKLSISIYVYLLEGNHWNEIFPSVFKEPKMGIARVMGASLLEPKGKWSRGTMIGWIHMICFHTPMYIYIYSHYIYREREILYILPIIAWFSLLHHNCGKVRWPVTDTQKYRTCSWVSVNENPGRFGFYISSPRNSW